MKRLSQFGALLTLAVLASAAETGSWTGTVVDVMCKGKDLANHTTKCAVACARGGFGLVMADGKFLKFDEAGNAKALAALKATAKEKDLKVRVSGSLNDELIRVSSIEVQ